MRETVEPSYAIKDEACFRCGINCHKNVYEPAPGGKAGPFLAKVDYEPLNILATNCGIDDIRRPRA